MTDPSALWHQALEASGQPGDLPPRAPRRRDAPQALADASRRTARASSSVPRSAKSAVSSADATDTTAKTTDAKSAESLEVSHGPSGFVLSQGPWRQAFAVQTDFALRSKSNFRRYARGRRAARAWAEFSDFEKRMATLIGSHLPSGWDLGRGLALPQRPVVVVAVIGRTTLDAANLSKSVLDACEGVVVVNDASVRFVAEASLRTRSRQSGVVAFALLEPGSSLELVMAAGAALVTEVAHRLDENGYLHTEPESVGDLEQDYSAE
jgi:hypothetical protein